MAELGKSLEAAISISVPDEVLIERISNRVSRKNCKAVYNLKFNPPKEEGNCNKCGGELIQRDDDRGDTVRKRLEVYNEQTNPLLEYYEKKKVYYMFLMDTGKQVQYSRYKTITGES